MCVAAGVATLLYGIPNAANATQVIRELWDGSGKANIAGDGSDASSVGFDNSKVWVVSPAGNTGLTLDCTWNLDGWMGVDENTVLGDNAGSQGTFAFYTGNMGTLTNKANNNLPYGNYYSQCYATRALATNSYINFQANGTYYFSVRMFRGMSSWSWTSDQMGGIGLASSSATNADFVGIGITRSSPYYASNGITDIGGGCYITAGTLNQAGTGMNIDPSSGIDSDGGPYYARAYTATNMFTDQLGLLVGSLTTTAGGASTMTVKLYPANAGPYPSDPSTITWDATYSFTETNVMTQLLVWENGGGTGVQDALRVGTTWADVIGLELTGPIQANPGATVYAGTPVTFSQSAGLNNGTYPMTFQWYSNSVAIADATNSSLALGVTTTDFTADYTIVVSNFFGELTNTPLHLTVNPAVKPFFTQQPVSTFTADVGGTYPITVGVDGTPTFNLQLTHAGTNVPGMTATLSGTGTATLRTSPLTIADAANSFAVVVTNTFGSATSQVANVTLLIPPAGSFEAVALANGAADIWKLSETTNDMTTNGVTLRDYVSDNNGNVPNEPGYPSMSNVVFGSAGPGPALPGFSGITSILTPNTGGLNGQVNLASGLLYSNSMTMVLWMNASGGEGIMYDRNQDSGSSQYGMNAFNGNLGAIWGDGAQWNSGIVLPGNQWIMVALVVEPNETTLYAGTNVLYGLTSVTRSSIEGTNHPNASGTLPNGRLVVGRTDYSWATGNNAWAYNRGYYCDAAIFYPALTPAAITNLYLAGFGKGFKVVGQSAPTNTISLNWYPTLKLQQAGSVAGPYTDVLDTNAAAVTPPYSQTMSNSMQFYRARQ